MEGVYVAVLVRSVSGQFSGSNLHGKPESVMVSRLGWKKKKNQREKFLGNGEFSFFSPHTARGACSSLGLSSAVRGNCHTKQVLGKVCERFLLGPFVLQVTLKIDLPFRQT